MDLPLQGVRVLEFDDPHLKASGGLTDITLMNGIKTQVPILPKFWERDNAIQR